MPNLAAGHRERIAAPPWRLRRLLAAPHRLAFFAAALVLAASGVWWAALWLAPLAGIAQPPWAVSRALAHGLLMAFGFMPLFFAGFLFTAGPRWLAQREVEAVSIAGPVLASLAGWSVFLCGVHVAAPLAAIGLAAAAWGLTGAARRFWRLVRTSLAPDRTHARVIAVALAVGVCALWGAALAIYLQREDFARASLQLGLWGFVAVVFATVAHRMIPFFSMTALPRVDARWPNWLLWVFLAALALEAIGAAAEALIWPLPWPLRAVQALIEAPVALLLIAFALRWRLAPSQRFHLRQRLPAMMHVGFAWLGVSLALAAVSHALQAATEGASSLGLAPTHALTMGFLGSTMVAMTTRVSCGHSGRTLVADDFVWRLFWLLQAAVLLRLLAALWPAGQGWALALAALAWAGVAVAWALRYGRWFGRPRADGRPG
ncbi:MAG: NnrS family protein [Ideonella sp.]|nr:NnrS family protein [Ideonella sp.]